MPNVHGRERFRCWPVYALSASVPVSIAAISLSKLALFLAALGLLLRPRQAKLVPYPWEGTTTTIVLLMLAMLALSMGYSAAPWNIAAIDVGKYAKLLLIPVIPYLVRHREQALRALACYASVQIFILFSSCAMAMGLALPWVSDPILVSSNSVFHEYLHQSIMTSGLAALCWHLRHEVKLPGFRWLAPALGVLALANVVFMLKGRSGYLSALAVLVAALLWESKKAWRGLALVAPILALVLIASPQIQSRVDLAITETLAYQPGNTTPSSVGARLNFWNRSIQAIAERPWTGFGAGSWGMQYKRLDAGADPWYKGSGGNPHQEFLLWGVLLGVGGIGLLCSLLASLWRDASRLASPHERAMKSVILVLVTTAMFNCVLYDGEIGDYFCLMLGLLLALGRAATAKGSEAIASPTGGAA